MANSPLGVQVIARAADVLRALEGKDQGLSLGQLAKELGLAKSTVQRIVAALDRENFVISASPNAGVRIGPALVRIARSTHFGLADIARPFLEDLVQKTGETVDLAILKGAQALFLDQIEGPHRLRAVSALGVSFPLHCSANGKAILSAMSEQDFARIKKKITLTKYTPNSPASWKQLEEEIARIRQTGIAYDMEEHALGISAVGTPIIGPGGELAAISIPTPTIRFESSKQELEDALKECRASLQDKIGTA